MSNNFHIDHIMPISAGGSNDDDNLQVLCLKCHQEKTENMVFIKEFLKLNPHLMNK